MTLGDIVKKYREEHDLSQRQFAVACELSNGYISMLEKNVNPKTGMPMAPSLLAMKKIAEVMGVTLNDLLEQVDDMPVSITEVSKEQQKTPTVDLDDGRIREFIELFRLLTADQQSLIIHEIKGILTNQ